MQGLGGHYGEIKFYSKSSGEPWGAIKHFGAEEGHDLIYIS